MLPLPPPPPSPLQAEPSPQPRKQGFPVSLNQIVISKQARNQQSSSAQTSNSDSKKLSKPPVFQTSSTSPYQPCYMVWCNPMPHIQPCSHRLWNSNFDYLPCH
ncbi:hypothetical protein OIU77_015650 [Salix suchowensis]|uniref:Uncharacterized protein n=1 Tax=Salix suchowensis TaxID=1278906 RepID=A0ABQ8ZHM9_9ROSI|nr:hypothetical protein OIU77_015650 [Salix suchowensis]